MNSNKRNFINLSDDKMKLRPSVDAVNILQMAEMNES